MMISRVIVCCELGGIPGEVIWCCSGHWRAALHGFTRLITAHNANDTCCYVQENKRQEAPTKEQLEELDCLEDLDLYETCAKS